MKAQISPAMMYADLMEIPKILRAFEANRVDYLHIDVMDGHFAPDYALCPAFCQALRKNTSLPLDIHLMVEKPEQAISRFSVRKNDIVSVHAESTYHLRQVLCEIRRLGARPFVALGPATPCSALDEVLDDIDGVLVMTVDVGFAQKKPCAPAIAKIARVRAYLDGKGKQQICIEAKGGVDFSNAKRMRAAGADIFVADASSVFKSDLTVVEGLVRLRTAIGA